METQSQHQILHLFPIPVLVNMLPEELGSITNWLFQQELLGKESVDEANYGQRSKNSYILDEPECNDLKKFILDNVQTFATHYMGYDYAQYMFGQSWISVKYPGQHHTMHTHPNRLISGVFYFGEPVEATPAITFHDGGANPKTPLLRPRKHHPKNIKPTVVMDSFNVPFIPGQLVIFPSYLQHSVPRNETDRARYSLAFNSIPTYGLGDERELTELKFHKKS
jgi:uncharacterized protein (TIGR02466 family)